jgi:hypothetical protein
MRYAIRCLGLGLILAAVALPSRAYLPGPGSIGLCSQVCVGDNADSLDPCIQDDEGNLVTCRFRGGW